MKISINIDALHEKPFATVEDGKGKKRAVARICLRTLNVLKSRNFSGSDLKIIETLIKPLARVADSLPGRV